MSDWSSGYNVDLGYTYGHHREISPTWLNYAATLRGVTPPTGDWRYLELGCGQGVGLILTAAQHPDHEFVGVDFNPLHIAHARSLATSAGLSNVRFEEADFVKLGEDWPNDWGKFDYVTAHGIYTWLAKNVRESLVRTIDNATKPGALVYLSYNTMPGWVSTIPVQHLLRLWQTRGEVQSVKAIKTGSDRLKDLIKVGSGMTNRLPGIANRLEQLEKQDGAYLVQEYLHDNWHPLWFNQVAEELEPAKLSYIGTATVGDRYLVNVLPPQQRDHLAAYDDPILREVMVDVLINQTFRRDVFARGATPLWPVSQGAALKATRFHLLKTPTDEDFKFKISAGEVSGKADVYRPLVQALEDGPKSLEQLLDVPGLSPRMLNDTVQAMTMLLHGNIVGLTSPVSDQSHAKSLNRAIATQAAEGAPYRYVAAPETGGVLQLGDTDMIMLAAVMSASTQPSAGDLATALMRRLSALGKGLIQDGKPVTDQTAMEERANALATAFLQKTVPALKKRGIL